MGAMTRTPVVWLTGSDDASRSAQRVKGALRAPVAVVPKDLEVWTGDPAEPYDLNTEVAAIEALADDRGWERLHLFGFSAGATVALATALRLGPRLATLAVTEPATIGDDDWSETEARWRSLMDEIFALPRATHQQAFNAAMLAPGEPVQETEPPPASFVERGNRLWTHALRRTGFTSGDLAVIDQPTLVLTGGRSNPRFAAVAARLHAVLPHVKATVFADESHLNAPHRKEPERVARLLEHLWSA